MMDIIVRANEELFKEAGSMCEALMEICKELCEEQLQEREKRAKEQTFMSLVRDGLLSVTEAAKRLSMSEEDFMEKMNTSV